MTPAATASSTKARRGRAKGSITRFPGIVNDARRLGVSIGHLRKVLIGERTSPELLERWKRRRATIDPNQPAFPAFKLPNLDPA